MSAYTQPLSNSNITPLSRVSLNSTISNVVLDSDSSQSSILVLTNSTPALYIDKFQNVGVNTTAPTHQLEVNSSNGACLKLTYNNSSNYSIFSMSNDGILSIASTGLEINISSNTNFNIKSHNGSTSGLKLNGTLITATADQLNYLSGVSAGTASASKALVLNSSSNITGINSLTATTIIGLLNTPAQTNITSLGTLTSLVVSGNVNISGHNGTTIGLELGGILVTASAIEINTLKGITSSSTQLNYTNVTPGTASASKALVLDSSSNISGINSLSTTALTVNGTSIDTSKLGYLIVTPGTASASKALVLDSSSNITGINLLTVSSLTIGTTSIDTSKLEYLLVTPGTASASKALVLDLSSNITGINSLSTTSLTVNGTSIDTTKLGYLALTPGTASASKALVLDSSSNISGINSLSTTALTVNGTSIDTSKLGYLTVTPGTASASKALVLDSSSNITGINSLTVSSLTIGTTQFDTNTLSYLSGITTGTASASKALVLDSSSNITGINSLTATSITVGGTTLDTTKLGYLNITPGTASASKALVLNSSSSITSGINSISIGAANTSSPSLDVSFNSKSAIIQAISLSATPDTGITATTYKTYINNSNVGAYGSWIGNTSNTPIYIFTNNSLSSAPASSSACISIDGSNMNIINHNGLSTGLQLNNTLVTSTAAELNYVSGLVKGTVSASKAVVVDLNKDITGFRNISGTGTITFSSTITTSSGRLTMSSSDLGISHFSSSGGANKSEYITVSNGTYTACGSYTNHPYVLIVNNGERCRIGTNGYFGINTVSADKQLEVNSYTGDCMRLTYNDNNGSATYYTDFSVSATGQLTIAPSSDSPTNGDILLKGSLIVGKNTGTNLIRFSGTTGDVGTNFTVIGERIYSGTECSELIIFKGNDAAAGSGPDRVRIRSAEFRVQTYTSAEDYSALGDNTDRLVVYNNGDVDIVNHTGSNGLKLGGTLLTATASQINTLAGVTAGTVSASKALVVDSNKDINGIRNLTITGTLSGVTSLGATITTAAQPNITSLGTLSNLTIAGSSSPLSLENSTTFSINTSSPSTSYDVYIKRSNTATGMTAGLAFLISSSAASTVVPTSSIVSVKTGTGASGDLIFYTNNSGTLYERTRITSSGRLGINSVYPDRQLEINATDGNCLRLTYNTSGGSATTYLDQTITSSGAVTFSANGSAPSYTLSGGNITITNSNDSTSTTSGALIVTGGISISSTTDATNTSNGGALTVAGGASFAKKVYIGTDLSVGSNLTVNGNLTVSGTTTTVSSTSLTIKDNTILLNSGPSASGYDSGIITQRYQISTSGNTGDVITDTAKISYSITSATSSSITLPAGASVTDNYYLNWWIKITSGVAINQIRKIVSYVGSTKVATLDSTLSSIPSANDTIDMFNRSYSVFVWQESNKRFATAYTSSDNTGPLTILDYSDFAANSIIGLSNISSTSNVTGAVQLSGGIGISNTTDAVSATNGGTFTSAGGGAFAKSLYVGTTLTASSLVGTLSTASQPNITSIGTLSSLTMSGAITGVTSLTTNSLILGSTTITSTATEINTLAGVTPGSVSIGKALVVDINKDLSSLRNVVLTGSLTANSIIIGSTTVTSTATELNTLAGVTAGTVTASKALVVDANKDLASIRNLTLTGSLTGVTSLTTGSLTLGATAVTSTATEINTLAGVTAGTVTASKALVVDANKDLASIRNLTLTGSLTIPTLVLNGTTITVTGSELNVLSSITAGTVSASKALVVDANKDLASIRNLTLTGSLTGVTSLTTGSLTLGSTAVTSTATEINTLAGVTAGTVLASKALVVDANKDLASIRNLTLTGSLTTPSLVIGSTTVNATATEINTLASVTAGTGSASKAVVLNSSNSITSGINSISIGSDNTSPPSLNLSLNLTTGVLQANSLSATPDNGITATILKTYINNSSAGAYGSWIGNTSNTPLYIFTNNSLSTTPAATAACISINGSNINIINHNGTSGLQLNGTLVTASATELNAISGITFGTAGASKLLATDASRNISNLNNVTATTLTGTLATAAQTNVTSVGTLTGLTSSGVVSITNNTTATSTTTGALKVTGGVGVAGDLYVGGSINGTLSTAAQTNITSVGTLTGLTSSGAVSITNNTAATSTTTGALKVTGGVGISGNLFVPSIMVGNSTDTARMISALDSTQAASSARYITLGKSNSIGNQAEFSFYYVGSGSANNRLSLGFYGGEKMSILYGGNVGIGTTAPAYLLDVSGSVNCSSLYIGTTQVTSTATEINTLAGVTPGTASASKALILNGSSSINGIATLSATTLSGTLSTPAQTNITSVGTLTGLTSSGIINITNNTASTTTSNGALVVTGGIGIGGALNVGGSIYGTLATAAQTNITSVGTLTGLTSSGVVSITNNTASTTTTTGALKVAGGVGIVGDVFIGGSINGTLATAAQTNITSVGTLTGLTSSGVVSITNNTASTTTTTGALKVAGGVGIVGDIFIGGSINGTLSNTTQTGITAVGTLTGLTVSGTTSFTNVTDATSSSVGGAITISGGAAVAKSMYIGQNLTIGGNLTISGTTTTVNSISLLVSDNTLVLNSGPSGTGVDAGIVAQRYQIDNDTGVGDIVSDTYKETYAISSSTTNTITLPGSANVTTDYYKNWWIKITSGTGINQVRKVTGYNGSTKVLTLSSNFTTTPAISDTINLYNKPLTTILWQESTDQFITAFTTSDTSAGSLAITDYANFKTNNISAVSLTATGSSSFTSNVSSTSTSTGSLVVTGGVGISGDIYIGGSIYGTLATASQTNITSVGTLTGLTSSGAVSITNNTTSSSTTTGALKVTGGVGIAGDLYVGGTINGTLASLTSSGIVNFTNNTASTTTSNGALVVTGGVGIGGALNVGGSIYGTLATASQTNITSVGTLTGLTSSGVVSITNNTTATSTTTGALKVTGGVGVAGDLYVGGTINGTLASVTTSGLVDITNTTAATSTTTGALKVAGGVGVSGSLFATRLMLGTSTDTARMISALDSNQAALSSKYITLGKSNTSGNQAEFSFYYVGDNDGSNRIGLGFYAIGERFTVLSNGNVGVGTIAPGYKLEVNGSINCSSFYISGTQVNSTATEINTLSAVTAGTASANKALILNGSSSISGIGTLSASTIYGTIYTASQTNITALGTLTGLTSSGAVSITNNTSSTSSTTGSLKVTGGVGIAGDLYVGGTINGTLGSLSSSGIVNFTNNTASTTTSNGALVVTGGVGIGGALNVGGSIYGTLATASQTNITSVGTLTGLTSSGSVSITNTTDATNSSTGGSLTISGGAAVAKKLYVGTSVNTATLTLTGNITMGNSTAIGTATYPNMTYYSSSGAIYIGKTTAVSASNWMELAANTDGYSLGLDGTLTLGNVNASRAAWGTQGTQLHVKSATYTDTTSTNAAAVQSTVMNSFYASTLAATNASVTISNAATLYIDNSPGAGTNVSISNPMSLWINNGKTLFGNKLSANVSSAKVTINSDNSKGGAEGAAHGLMIVAGTTNNASMYMGADSTNNLCYIQSSKNGANLPILLNNRGGNVGVGVDATPSYTLHVNGSFSATSYYIGSNQITASASEINTLAGVTTGSTSASKALVVDANKDLTGIRNFTITGSVTSASLVMGAVTATSTELGYIVGLTTGTTSASKALVVDANKDLTGIRNFTITGSLTTPTLVIGATTVTATATEINYLAGSSVGSGTASKALVLDSSRNVTNINSLTTSTSIATTSRVIYNGTNYTDLTTNSGGTLIVSPSSNNANTTTSDIQLKGSVIIGKDNSINLLRFHGTTGDLDSDYSVIGERIYSGTEQSELIIFKGNDTATTSGPDRIRMRSAEFRFQTFTAAETFNGTNGNSLQDNNDRMVITNAGSIGIGRSDPQSVLDIYDTNSNHFRLSSANGNATFYSSPTAGILVIQANGPDPDIYLMNHVYIHGSKTESYNGNFYYHNGSSVGPATNFSNRSFALSTNGGICVRSGEIDVLSDYRLKTDISELTLDSCKQFIELSRPVKFKWKSSQDTTNYTYGFIAQDILKSQIPDLVDIKPIQKDTDPLPEIVEELENGDILVSPSDASFSMCYDNIIAIHTTVIKDLYKKNEDLENENKLLKAQMSAILERLDKLESK